MPIKFATTTTTTALSTTYATVASTVLEAESPLSSSILYGVTVRINTIAGGAASVTISISSDAAGDVILVPATVCTIGTGVTTATKGAVALRCEFPVQLSARTLYVSAKTDAGTATADTIIVSYGV